MSDAPPAANVTPFPVLCDLDGVVWLSHQPIHGSVDAIARLRARGHRVLFVTNNSASRIAEQEAALAAIGIPATGDVLSSSDAAALLVEPGERVMVCGGPGIIEAITARGALAVEEGPYDVVMVGFHRTFDYAEMSRSSAAVRGGARLIGTNDDATYPTPDGPIPGGGSILVGIATASGVAPIVAGKPYAPMATLVRTITGITDLRDAVMVGDRPDTDGRFATTLGCRYAQVWSGVTVAGTLVQPTPWIEGADLAAIADQLLA
ncbi:MAG: putative phosphatase [Acidimicrobiales bacterium]|nr:putative phosphatase [Acidimicrobiales bacterium]